MKKLLLGFVLYSLLLCLCASACAEEPTSNDYEDFAAYLQEQGITIPQTLEEAMGDTDFSDVPEFELIVDEENDQYVLRTDLGEADAYISIFSNDLTLDRDFQKTDEPGVYVAKGIGQHTDLHIIVPDEKDPDIYRIECYFDLENPEEGPSVLKEYHLTDTIIVSKHMFNYGGGTGTFDYILSKKAYTNNEWYYEESLQLEFLVPTGELESVYYQSMHDNEASLSVIFIDKALRFLHYGDYDYSIYDGWEKNGEPCDLPFTLTPELPYPTFLP